MFFFGVNKESKQHFRLLRDLADTGVAILRKFQISGVQYFLGFGKDTSQGLKFPLKIVVFTGNSNSLLAYKERAKTHVQFCLFQERALTQPDKH